MLIFAALLGNDRKRDGTARHQLEELAKDLPTLGRVCVEEKQTGSMYLGIVRQPEDDVVPREYVHESGAIVTFFDGLIFSGTEVVVTADRVASEWQTLPDRVEGNFVAVRADLARSELELFVDPFGLKQVFVVRDDDTWLVSNSQHVILKLLKSPKFDDMALPMFLGMQGTGHGKSIINGMCRLPGGSRLRWSGETGSETSTPYYERAYLTTLPERKLTDSAIERTEQWLSESLRSLSGVFGAIRSPITGGRDSRVLASIVSGAKIPCGLFTEAKEGSREALVSTAVAKQIGIPHELASPRPRQVASNWDRALDLFLVATDGNASLWQLPNVLNMPEERKHRPVVLGGHGGELARTPFLMVWDLLDRSGRSVLSALPDRMCDSYEGLLRDESCNLAKNYIRDCVTDLQKGTSRWENIVDAISYFERQCTRDGAAIRIGHPHRDMFTPFYSRVFAEEAWHLPGADRYFERFHREIIRAADPNLLKIPYDSRSWKWGRLTYNLVQLVNQHLNLSRLRRRKQLASSTQEWTFSMLPQLRVLCLDQASSPIWEHVDRNLFDQVTGIADQSDFKPIFGDGILKVATVFLLADRYGIQ